MINLKRLKTTLLTSGLQQKDQPLFQVINQLIDALQEFVNTTDAFISGGGSSTTINNITNNLLQLIESSGSDGSGDTVIVPGPPGINGQNGLTIPGNDGLDGQDQFFLIPSSVIDTYAIPLTNGNGEAPEIIFDSFGDVVMVTGIPT